MMEVASFSASSRDVLAAKVISIWKYKDAPQLLKGLYSRATSVEWVLKSPAELVLEVEVLLEGAATEVSRCPQHDGTIVFFGRSKNRPMTDVG